MSKVDKMLSRENLITTSALLCLRYYQGFIFGAGFISTFYIDQDCDVGLCPVSYISALLFPLVGLISLLAGDRLGSIYGTKTVFKTGCLWRITWILMGSISTNLKIVTFCLRMASIGGLIDFINSPNMLDLSVTTLFETVFTGSISMFGAYSGGQFVRKISLLATRPFVWSAVLSAVALFIVHIYLPDNRPKLRNPKTDWVGIIFGILGLSIMNLTAEISSRYSLFNQQNLAISLLLSIYWSIYALVEIKYAGKHALFPTALWPDIVLYNVLILACTHTILRGVFDPCINSV